MNNIYRVVRDPVNGGCKVTSELAKRRNRGGVVTRATLPACIGLGVAMLASASAGATDYTAPILAGPGQSVQLVSGDTVRYTGSSYALTAQGQDASLAATDLDLVVTGASGSGIAALAGGSVAIEGGRLKLGNGTANSVYALSASGAGSVIRANNLVIDAYRNASGFGTLDATAGGAIWLTGGSITSTGTALTASGAGSALHLNGTTINSGPNSTARISNGALLSLESLTVNSALNSSGVANGWLSASGAGTVLALKDVIVLGGYYDIGAGALITLDGGRITATGDAMRLLGSSNQYATAQIKDTRLESTGGYGINVNNWGKVAATRADITARDGGSGVWLPSVESQADLTDSRISTYGSNGYGHGVEVSG
ncbi:MAG: hypothetical protein ACREOX_05550, partial [Stenotrophomonas sp.]